jgi:hypothetical protein
MSRVHSSTLFSMTTTNRMELRRAALQPRSKALEPPVEPGELPDNERAKRPPLSSGTE